MSRSFVFMASSFPRSPVDAAGRFVFDLGAALVARGHRVRQLAPATRGCPPRETFAAGHDLHRFPWSAPPGTRGLVYGDGIGANLRRAPGRVLAVPGLLRGFGRALAQARAEDPDAVVVSHWALPAGWVAARARRRRGRGIHLSVAHGGGVQLLARNELGRRALRSWTRGSDGLLFVSGDLRGLVGSTLGDAELPVTRVAAMGIDPERFRPPRDAEEKRRLRTPYLREGRADRMLVIGVGRLVHLKGFDRLVDALTGRAEVVLALAGEGPEERALAERAGRQGVDLLLLGRLGPDDLRDLYAAADLMVFPGRLGPGGRREGAPMVLAEALHTGCPVLATATGGVPERLADSAGSRLVPADDDGALGAALGELLDDRAALVALGEAARREDRSRFDRDRTAQALEELLRDAENGGDVAGDGPE